MNLPNKMMMAVGAIALTATTLLAGCGDSSNNAVEPAAAESAAVEVPASVFEGLVQPAGVSDENWAAWFSSAAGIEDLVSAAKPPKELSNVCEAGFGDSDKIGEAAERVAAIDGTSVEEWTQVYTTLYENVRLQACSLAG